jgi:hypothetical protein
MEEIRRLIESQRADQRNDAELLAELDSAQIWRGPLLERRRGLLYDRVDRRAARISSLLADVPAEQLQSLF